MRHLLLFSAIRTTNTFQHLLLFKVTCSSVQQLYPGSGRVSHHQTTTAPKVSQGPNISNLTVARLDPANFNFDYKATLVFTLLHLAIY